MGAMRQKIGRRERMRVKERKKEGKKAIGKEHE